MIPGCRFKLSSGKVRHDPFGEEFGLMHVAVDVRVSTDRAAAAPLLRRYRKYGRTPKKSSSSLPSQPPAGHPMTCQRSNVDRESAATATNIGRRTSIRNAWRSRQSECHSGAKMAKRHLWVQSKD